MIENAWKEMLVAAAPGVPVNAIVLPQSTPRPAITYQIISAPRWYTQDGPAEIGTFRIQTDVWADNVRGCAVVRDLLVAALSGQFKRLAGSPEIRILGIFVDNERDNYASTLDQAGPKLFQKSLDFIVTAQQG